MGLVTATMTPPNLGSPHDPVESLRWLPKSIKGSIVDKRTLTIIKYSIERDLGSESHGQWTDEQQSDLTSRNPGNSGMCVCSCHVVSIIDYSECFS